MTDPTFAGDPGAMIRAGWRVRELAEATGRDVTGRQGRLTVPGSTNTAWASGSVAAAVTSDWQVHLSKMAGRVESFGADVVQAGTDYRAADNRAERRMR